MNDRKRMAVLLRSLGLLALGWISLAPASRAQALRELQLPVLVARNYNATFDSTNDSWDLERLSLAVNSSRAVQPCTGNAGETLDASALRVSLDPAEHNAGAVGCGPQNKTWNPRSYTKRELFPMAACSIPASVGSFLKCSDPAFSFAAFSSDLSSSSSILLVKKERERFHWGPALWQSFEFLVLEHAWRLAWDPYARYLLFHKPFWHDYLASANHFDMNRWGDGDDFLVNYIGHPLEGSVSGNIFLQNDPQGRSARFGKSSAYWHSRMKAMAWAAAYSAYFEIGPILSEAALGNEGGYTYVPGCGFYPTCEKKPGEKYKSPTNNTGWVDFVVTPVIGTGWTVLEDAIEAEIVDRLANGSPALKYKILRGALAPARTMSNFLAGKPPWYRYSDSPENSVARAFGSAYPLKPATRPDWMDDPRWSLGLQVTSLQLPMDWDGCAGCRTFVPGVGLTLGYRFSRMIFLDSEYNYFPASGSRGGARETLAGLKIGRPFRSWGIFSQVRPGFIHYDKALVPGASNLYDSTTRFAIDLGGSVEYYASRHSTVRFNMGTTLVHYLTGHPDPKQPPVSVLSNDYYNLQGSFHVTSGYVFRF